MAEDPVDKNPLADVAARRQRILASLADAQIEPLVGLVAPAGCSAVRFPPSDDWIFQLDLEHWRVIDGPVEDKPVRIQMVANDSEQREALMSRLKPLDLVTLRARLLNDAESGGAQGLLVQLEDEHPSDPELEALRDSLLAPVTLDHGMFGTLTLNRKLGWFETDTIWQSKHIRLCLNTDENSDQLAAMLTTAETLFSSEDEWHKTLTRFSADKLLKLRNDEWREQDEPQMTTQDFTSRMTLESITVHEDGELEFCFDDGDLFWGHVILVSASLANGPSDATIAG